MAITLLPAGAQLPTLADVAARLSPRDKFIVFHCAVLLGYALDGRGFAYVGFPPIFIGEMSLALGIASFATAKGWRRVLSDWRVWPLLGLGGWGLCRTLPFVGQYGVDAVRDAVVWGYGAFAVILATLIVEKPARLARLATLYRGFFGIFLVGIPIVFVIYHVLLVSLPRWPWANIEIVQIKEGDVLVHLAGIVAFWVSGLAGPISWPWVALLTVDAATMGVIDRAGMMAFLAVFGLAFLFRPRHQFVGRAVLALVVAAFLLWVTDLRVPVPGGKGREVSFQQVVTNLGSVTGDTGNEGLDSTKEWRMEWWAEVARYTFHGRYFWTGKGFGINLADDDGFQVLHDKSLRSPHSVHMTMLARGGVPMLALWVVANLTWAGGVLDGFLRSRAAGRKQWEGLFFFLLAYWAAFLINGSFDVFIEGPMGGIWFWSIYGAGLGAIFTRGGAPAALDSIVPVVTPPTLAADEIGGAFA